MKKKIPVGIMNYKELRMENYYTVDKTLMIKEFLEQGSKVTLITRPRRFGKTLNMSMMAEFFDISKDSKALFEGLSIMDTEYAKEMNQYPVIYLTFKDAHNNEVDIVRYIKLSLAKEYKKYMHVFENLDSYTAPVYQMIHECIVNMTDISLQNANYAIAFLAECLENYYHKKVMIFIDEYDTPFIQAHINKCYESLHADLAALLRTSLKGCDSVHMAMLTGIQRVAKESIFSDLNNLDVCTVSDGEYAQYFGFTTEETTNILNAYGLSLNDEVKSMYDGYRIGDYDIYNPWSIIKYAKNKKLSPYWVNTSSNVMIKQALKTASTSFNENYEELIKTGSITTSVNLNTSFYEVADDDSLWGLLVNAGYLTISGQQRRQCILKIPNKEVQEEFQNLTMYYLNVNSSTFNKLIDAIYLKQKDVFIQTYSEFLLQIPSYHDLENENSYHMLLLGLCAYLLNDYEIISNREEGYGRCDLILKAKKINSPSYVIEFKHLHIQGEYTQKERDELKRLAQDAVKQIEDKQYDTELTGEVIYIGLAHYGKHVECIWKRK